MANSNLEGNLKSLGVPNFFLRAPRDLVNERRGSVTSIQSIESNVFKRGIDTMSARGRRSTLFEVKYH